MHTTNPRSWLRRVGLVGDSLLHDLFFIHSLNIFKNVSIRNQILKNVSIRNQINEIENLI